MPTEFITVAGVSSALSAKLLYDVCGPTAKYVGGEIASYAEAGANNLKRIFTLAGQRMAELGKGEGQIPPRLLKNILQEGYFCEDELEALYLGGVLASSKGPITRDDRAVAYSTLISSLSAYQIRTHYILYSTILRFHEGALPQLIRNILRGTGATVMIAEKDYVEAMEFSESEVPSVIAEHSFVGLQQKGLSEGGFNLIRPNPQIIGLKAKENFRCFYPTLSGIELFLWGLGVGDKGIKSYDHSLLSNTLPKAVVPLDIQLGKVSYT